LAFHVLNRAAGRGRLFVLDADYLAMFRVIEETHKRLPMRIVTFCLMPTHWHLVLWPREDDELSEFMRLSTLTHSQRGHAHHESAGTGPVYQGRFKSFPIQKDDHFLTVCRYVERNAVRANLVRSAQNWRWSAPGQRTQEKPPAWLMRMEDWPVRAPEDWSAWVNRGETAKELEALRISAQRGRPFGDQRWQKRTARDLELESTIRPRGRQQVRPIKDSRPL
jgi:putative transposase